MTEAISTCLSKVCAAASGPMASQAEYARQIGIQMTVVRKLVQENVSANFVDRSNLKILEKRMDEVVSLCAMQMLNSTLDGQISSKRSEKQGCHGLRLPWFGGNFGGGSCAATADTIIESAGMVWHSGDLKEFADNFHKEPLHGWILSKVEEIPKQYSACAMDTGTKIFLARVSVEHLWKTVKILPSLEHQEWLRKEVSLHIQTRFEGTLSTIRRCIELGDPLGFEFLKENTCDEMFVNSALHDKLRVAFPVSQFPGEARRLYELFKEADATSTIPGEKNDKLDLSEYLKVTKPNHEETSQIQERSDRFSEWAKIGTQVSLEGILCLDPWEGKVQEKSVTAESVAAADKASWTAGKCGGKTAKFAGLPDDVKVRALSCLLQPDQTIASLDLRGGLKGGKTAYFAGLPDGQKILVLETADKIIQMQEFQPVASKPVQSEGEMLTESKLKTEPEAQSVRSSLHTKDSQDMQMQMAAILAYMQDMPTETKAELIKSLLPGPTAIARPESPTKTDQSVPVAEGHFVESKSAARLSLPDAEWQEVPKKGKKKKEKGSQCK